MHTCNIFETGSSVCLFEALGVPLSGDGAPLTSALRCNVSNQNTHERVRQTLHCSRARTSCGASDADVKVNIIDIINMLRARGPNMHTCCNVHTGNDSCTFLLPAAAAAATAEHLAQGSPMGFQIRSETRFAYDHYVPKHIPR